MCLLTMPKEIFLVLLPSIYLKKKPIKLSKVAHNSPKQCVLEHRGKSCNGGTWYHGDSLFKILKPSLKSCRTFFMVRRMTEHYLKEHSSVLTCHCPLSTSYITTYKNPTHFSQNSFISEIWCLFTSCPYSINVTVANLVFSSINWKCRISDVYLQSYLCDKLMHFTMLPSFL